LSQKGGSSPSAFGFINRLTTIIDKGETMETTEKHILKKETEHEIVFFIDMQQFKTRHSELSVRVILQNFAKEDPTQTTLVLRHGNDLVKYTNLDEIIHLKNGMKFVVYHNTPTPVSSYVRT
jgi:hypothetical protein